MNSRFPPRVLIWALAIVVLGVLGGFLFELLRRRPDSDYRTGLAHGAAAVDVSPQSGLNDD